MRFTLVSIPHMHIHTHSSCNHTHTHKEPHCACATIYSMCIHTFLGDHSASLNTHEDEIDKQLQEALLMEDPDILIDLRALNSNQSDKYSVFWKKCESYLKECTAVHERWHDHTTYLACAISVRPCGTSKLCPEDTPIPSQQWVRLQFYPRNPRTKTAELYRKRLPVKMMIQKRQFRKTHIDEHYCAAIFRYIQEYALLFKRQGLLIHLDQSWWAQLSCGRGVVGWLSLQEEFQVGNHNFTRFSIIPSVIFRIDHRRFVVWGSSMCHS